MGASKGKPYCMNAQKYIEYRSLNKMCEECEHIRYIGCPGFMAKTRNPYNRKTRWWIDWWYHDKPVPKEYYDKPVPKEYYKIKKTTLHSPCYDSRNITYDEINKKSFGDPRGRDGI